MTDLDRLARVVLKALHEESDGSLAYQIAERVIAAGWVRKRPRRTARLKKAAGKSVDMFQTTVSEQRKFKP